MTRVNHKYISVKNKLKALIDQGSFIPGQRLPTTTELSQQYGVSYVTADRACRELVREGVVQRQPRKGTFVSDSGTDVHNEHRGRFALVIPYLSSIHTTMPDLVDGVEQVAHDRGYELVLMYTDHRLDKAQLAVDKILSGKFAGVMFVPVSTGKTFIEDNRRLLTQLRDNSVPFVVVGHCEIPELDPISGVSSDHYKALREQMDHLVALGHHRIALLCPEPNGDRMKLLEGFHDAASHHGLDIPASYVRQFTKNDSCGVEAKHILSMQPRPTAILTTGDSLAVDVIRAVQEMGMHVPDDVAVLGFGDSLIGRYFSVPLTTSHIRHREEGQLLAGMLADLIEGHLEQPCRIELPCQLIVRRSCGSKQPGEFPAAVVSSHRTDTMLRRSHTPV